MTQDTEGAALFYASLELPVLPVHGIADGRCTCQDPACGHAGKHPRTAHGLKDASVLPAAIRGWWTQWPDSNVAVAVPRGFLVVDVDTPEALAALSRADITFDGAPRARTGGGGLHFWFRTDREYSARVGLVPGVDLRTAGRSFVIMPPSVHESGNPYAWEIPLDEIPDAPPELLAFIETYLPRAPGAAPAGNGGSIPEGQRNATLASMAGAMRRRGMTPEAIAAALTIENRRCAPPLPEREVENIARSVGQYAAATESWAFLTVAQLSAVAQGPDIEWVMRGFLAKRHVTLMPGVWKSGKTTFITHCIKAIGGGGPFCGLGVEPGPVTIVSEEGLHIWAARATALDLGEYVDFLLRPFPQARPTMAQWISLAEFVAGHARGRTLVVLDSIHNLWGVEQENDNAEQLRWLEPLHMITDSGAALLLAGHPSKAIQAEGKSTRGGGAIGGWVDILMEFRRYDPDDPHNRLRVLAGFSRFEETPLEMVVEYRADRSGYDPMGTKTDVRTVERKATEARKLDRVLGILAVEPGMLTPEEVSDRWPDGDAPSLKTVKRFLNALVEQNRARRERREGRQGGYKYGGIPG